MSVQNLLLRIFSRSWTRRRDGFVFACRGRSLSLTSTLLFTFAYALAGPHIAPLAAGQPPNFDTSFLPRTMRVDYYHSGNATEDRIALERIIADGDWAGSRTQLLDTLDRGLYGYEVHDARSKQLLYSRGFCSVFGEWQTTTPAREQWGTFHESLRFPWPKGPVVVTLKKRVDGQWTELWSLPIDPESRFVNRADLTPRGQVWTVFENGPSAEKLDVVVLGDGYTTDDLPKFHADVARMVECLFAEEPFKSRRADFNVRAVDVVSPASGISQPREAKFRRSALGCEYNTFDLERYVLTADNRSVRDAAACAPYDNLIILFNNSKYGGGGIYNDQTTVAADAPFADYILVHEFGHHVAGLADEYYVSNVAYVTGNLPKFEPWEPNITALLDPAQLKWRDLLAANTPVPTPWKKAEYEASAKQTQKQRQAFAQGADAEAHVAGVMRQEQQSLTSLLSSDPYAGKVGVFEGASYEVKGLYRPAIDCIMFSRNKVGFCPICRRAINQAIDAAIDRQSSH